MRFPVWAETNAKVGAGEKIPLDSMICASAKHDPGNQCRYELGWRADYVNTQTALYGYATGQMIAVHKAFSKEKHMRVGLSLL